MNSSAELSGLIEAVDRNTAATRSISILLLGYIPWLIIGGFIIWMGNEFPYTIGDTTGFAFLVLFVGAIVTLILAFSELLKSSKT